MLLCNLVMILLERLFNVGRSVLLHPIGVIANIMHHCNCSLEKVVTCYGDIPHDHRSRNSGWFGLIISFTPTRFKESSFILKNFL